MKSTNIFFSKYEGAGNDFILIDDRALFFPIEDRELIAKMCHRKKGIGADGLILWQNSSQADLRMRIFNADGKEADMCGNGLRCLVHFAYTKHVRKMHLKVETNHAILPCHFIDNKVESILTFCAFKEKPFLIDGERVYFAHTGVPHAVVFVDDLDIVEFAKKARKIRYHPCFSPQGANVNFVKVLERSQLLVRTYERGVEDETGSCGTGIAASCLVASNIYGLGKKMKAISQSKALFEVELQEEGISLCAPVHFVFEGSY